MASRDGRGQGNEAMLSVVAPLFNERENLGDLHRRLTLTLESLGLDDEIILVDDGSVDETPGLLASLRDHDPHVVAVTLSRNFGHQAAVCAGLDHARGDAVVVMDAGGRLLADFRPIEFAPDPASFGCEAGRRDVALPDLPAFDLVGGEQIGAAPTLRA